jgi:hypothetical protein
MQLLLILQPISVDLAWYRAQAHHDGAIDIAKAFRFVLHVLLLILKLCLIGP